MDKVKMLLEELKLCRDDFKLVADSGSIASVYAEKSIRRINKTLFNLEE